MQYPVKVFRIARDAKPDVAPEPAGEFVVSGETVEEARRQALDRLAAENRAVRCLSFTTDGGIAVVVYSTPPPPVPVPRATRRPRGGR